MDWMYEKDKKSQRNWSIYMDEIISRDDEKGRELAKETGRKQGQQEERAREAQKDGWGTGVKIILSLVVLAIIVVAIGFLTLSVSVMTVSPGNALPYTTNYAVTFPEGQPIAIGNSHITVLSFQNEIISDIDGNRQKLAEGEDRVIEERRALITTFGVITLVDTNFQINLKYKGNRDNLAYFDMAIHTSQQVPGMLLNRLIPPEIHAQPM
ncbi:MAG: hypothetical protein CVV30_01340 [Methanomicrobiales archaeon HGW-Methanomicrobiales-1]|jgi:hypothetical protein|nr:MAG: hypothetical protein CVV30_01340 [Methanomicrobiales archaeon HGW-Methanomicrobiales-1]